MNILLVRLRLIGDVVFTTPSIRALRRRFPDSRLSYLVEPGSEPVVRRNPHLDEVIVADRPGSRGRLAADLRLAVALARRRFDLVIDFHGGPRAAWLARATGAPRRIGYDIPGRRWMYTEAVPRARELRPRHSVVNQWDLIRPLGIGPPDRAIDRTEMALDPSADSRVTARLADRGIDPDRERIVVVHVSAGNPFRRWPEARFIDLVARLAAADAARRIVLTAGPSDADAARRIGEEATARLDASGRARAPIVADLEMDLAELHALVRRAALFVGGDSGPLHVAGTTDTAIVGLYGPTLPSRSAPWRGESLVAEAVEVDGLACRPCDQRRCVPGDFRCLAGIEAARVVEACERAISARAALRPRPEGRKPA